MRRLNFKFPSGINAIQVYVPWNFHETVKGRYLIWGFLHFIYNGLCNRRFEFSGDKNLAEFVRLAQKADLDVLLRIGPYVGTEWEAGEQFTFW